MALLDIFRNIGEKMGKGMERNIGGLLGVDPESLTPEERKQARRLSQMAVFDALARGTTPTAGLQSAAALLGAQREERSQRQRQKAAEEEMQRISAMTFGGAGPTGQKLETLVEGEEPYQMTRYFRQDPKEALRRMYGTSAGRDVAQMAPGLMQLAQEGTTGRTVGGAVYNPLTGQFTRPPEEPKPRVPVREVDVGNQVIVYYNDGTTEKINKGLAPSAAGAGGVKDPQDLRKEVNAQLKPYTEVGDMWAKVRQAGSNPTAANDLALIFGYMKILDPGSVVREGEFANAQNAGGVGDRIRATYNNVLRGERLTEAQRQDFMKSAYGAVQSQIPRVQSVVDYYSNVATAIGVKPESVIRNPLKDAVIPKVTNDADYAKLPAGTLFEDPNGNLRTKPRSK